MSDPSLAPVISDHNRLAALYEVSRALGTSLNLDEALSIAVDAAIRLTKAERGFLVLADPDSGELHLRVDRRVGRRIGRRVRRRVGRRIRRGVGRRIGRRIGRRVGRGIDCRVGERRIGARIDRGIGDRRIRRRGVGDSSADPRHAASADTTRSTAAYVRAPPSRQAGGRPMLLRCRPRSSRSRPAVRLLP